MSKISSNQPLTKTREFLESLAKHINGSPSCDALLPALLQIRERCLENLSIMSRTEVKADGNLGCRWCLNSWSLGQYSLRLLPQKRPRGYRALRSKFIADPKQATSGKNAHKNVGHNFLSLKCDVCLGITKVPTLKPIKPPEPVEESPSQSLKKKKKKSKKRDDFAGLNPTAVKSAKKTPTTTPTSDCTGKQVLNVFEVLSPSPYQNGVNIVSNRSTKSRSKPSVSVSEKSIIKRLPPAPPVPKTTSLSSNSNKNKKKKVKTGHVEKPKKTKTVSSAIASFLNSL